MTAEEIRFVICLYVVIFLYGIVIGSFLNVCILRVPLRESIAKERSHCMKCGYQLAWFDLIPLFSYLFLGGKCRKCKEHISAQYPIIEGLNGVLYVLIFLFNGWSIDSIIYCLLTSALLVLMVIDYREHEIPRGVNMFILALGLINLGFHLGDWVSYGIGLVAVSIISTILFFVFKGKILNFDEFVFLIIIGFMCKWKSALAVCIIGLVLWIAAIFVCKVLKKMRTVPFGSCLAVAVYSCFLLTAYLNV